MSIFGYSLIKTEEKAAIRAFRHKVDDAARWLSGFEDLQLLWEFLWSREWPFNTDEMRKKYAELRESDVYGKSFALKRAEELERQLNKSQESVRYALATFRALDQYTFEDSDHGLLIKQAVGKLEEAEV